MHMDCRWICCCLVNGHVSLPLQRLRVRFWASGLARTARMIGPWRLISIYKPVICMNHNIVRNVCLLLFPSARYEFNSIRLCHTRWYMPRWMRMTQIIYNEMTSHSHRTSFCFENLREKSKWNILSEWVTNVSIIGRAMTKSQSIESHMHNN